MSGRREGAGWGVAAALFACGLALGSAVTRSPIQMRIPGGGSMVPPPLPALLPFYAAALALPLFLWLARRAPLTREGWRRALPLWAVFSLLVVVLPEVGLFVALGHGLAEPLLPFLGMRLLGTGPLVAGSAALAHAIEHRRRARAAVAEAAEVRAELVGARLSALTAQLRPHFLFNTLQSISTLVHRDPDAADAMIGRLGDLLRASLEAADTRFVSLDEEFRLTSAYLEIMRERFGDRLQVSTEMAVNGAQVLVPPLLLQPLVENAVQHGIEPSPWPGRVRLRAGLEAGRLVLQVWNSAEGTVDREPTARIGLGNTRERLAALYGDGADLSIEQHPGEGTCVTLRLPLSQAPAPVEIDADAQRAHR